MATDVKVFIDIFHTTLLIISILGTFISFCVARWKEWKWKHQKPPLPQAPPRKDSIFYVLNGFTFAFLALFFAVLVKVKYFPGFVIIYPHDGQTVVSDEIEIEVKGIGGRPGEIINVYVSDGHSQFKQRGLGVPSKNGNWVVENVVLQTAGYEYSIWAETQRDGVIVVTDNRIKVTRMDSSHRLIVFIYDIIPYFLLVMAFIAGAYLFLRHRRKTSR